MGGEPSVYNKHMKLRAALRSALCAALSSAMVALSPGLGAYQALALDWQPRTGSHDVDIAPRVNSRTGRRSALPLKAAPAAGLPVSLILNSGEGAEARPAAPAVQANVPGEDAPAASAALPPPDPIAGSGERLSKPDQLRFLDAVKRLDRSFKALRRAFAERRDSSDLRPASRADSELSGKPASTPAGASPLRSGAAPAPLAKPAPRDADARRSPPAPKEEGPGAPKKGPGWFGLGAAAATFLAALLAMQLGLEAQGQAMATLTEKAFGDFSILAQVSIFSQIGAMAGQQLAQPIIGRLGLAKTYYAGHFLRAASIGAMIFLLGTGMMPLGLMYVFYLANGVMTGIATTADGTLRKMLIGTGGGRQERFRVVWQMSAEVIGAAAPIAFGALVSVIGPSLVTAIYPATIVAGLLILIARKVLPKDAALTLAGADGKAGAGGKGGLLAALKSLWRTMVEGKDVVLRNPVLKYSALGAAMFDILNVFLYRLLAPGYGKIVAGAAGMSPIQGMIVGLFSFGGLLTAVMLLALQRGSKQAARAAAPAQSEDAQRRSVLRWTLLGAPAVLLLGTMALSTPTLGSLVALPPFLKWAGALTLPAVAMIPFGFLQVAASIKLNSFFTDNLPDPEKDPANKELVQKAVAFQGSAMTLLSVIGMLAMKPLFGHLGTFNPFPYLAIATIPLALGLFFVQRKLAAATKPGSGADKTSKP